MSQVNVSSPRRRLPERPTADEIASSQQHGEQRIADSVSNHRCGRQPHAEAGQTSDAVQTERASLRANRSRQLHAGRLRIRHGQAGTPRGTFANPEQELGPIVRSDAQQPSGPSADHTPPHPGRSYRRDTFRWQQCISRPSHTPKQPDPRMCQELQPLMSDPEQARARKPRRDDVRERPPLPLPIIARRDHTSRARLLHHRAVAIRFRPGPQPLASMSSLVSSNARPRPLSGHVPLRFAAAAPSHKNRVLPAAARLRESEAEPAQRATTVMPAAAPTSP